eukprot:TRINITY_DN9055_c0_g1_i1.p1 TRINITY_DN9055_c0_g1~~TRINITY_DN9055_c0_g1_i1.p1  ORF type:complete len:503 (+),score=62.66 TRINITY_DN9055_c0_g1_i1:14-1522(+)
MAFNGSTPTDELAVIEVGGGIFQGVGPIDTAITLLLVQVMLVQALTRVLRLLFSRIRQPCVIAEVFAGIFLGPSVLGLIPGFSTTLFPDDRMDILEVVGELGVILFLFIVGLETDVAILGRKWSKSFLISVSGISFPFALGCSVSYFLHNFVMERTDDVDWSFMLFIGIAMSITAFPILARILADLQLLDSIVGVTALSAAACEDAISWGFLALVTATVASGTSLNFLYIIISLISFALFILFPIRWGFMKLLSVLPTVEPLAFRNVESRSGAGELVTWLSLILCVFCAWFTAFIGVHSIFGAFLAGLAVPRDQGVSKKIVAQIEDIVNLLFLPLYFACSGLRTNMVTLNTWSAWLAVVLVIVAASSGKIMGVMVATHFTDHFTIRESFSIGLLMNTKGLVELIVLNIGLDVGILDTKVFTIFVIMALVTTLSTSPLLLWISPQYRQVILENGDDAITGEELEELFVQDENIHRRSRSQSQPRSLSLSQSYTQSRPDYSSIP